MSGVFIAILLPIILRSQILNTDLHLNESQPWQRVQFVTEYFVDQEKYFYLISLHQNVAICIGATTLTGTGTLIVGFVICACGMFKITSYRVEQAMTTKIFKNINLENQSMFYKDIIDAVKLHRKAIKFCEFASSTFKNTFILLIITCVISLSLNIYGVSLFSSF
ncbi:hypothetical protein ACFW04_012300 [Cataglyphis niger]